MATSSNSETTYAIVGATGNCGQALMRLLLKRENVRINAFCRNQDKLYKSNPGLKENEGVHVYQGNIQDERLLADCVRNCQAVYLVASTNDNVPGCHISQDLAHGMIGAMRILQDSKQAKGSGRSLPKLCLLSSSTINPHLSKHMGFMFRQILSRAVYHVYEDLRQAERILREQEDWITTIYMKPGGLSLDVQRGHELSLDDDETFVSYLDVAAGMIEACDDSDGKYDLKNVSARNAPGKGTAKFASGTPKCLLFGMVRYYLPFMHPYLPLCGPA